MVYTINIYDIYSFSGFRGQHHSHPVPVPQDILDDVLLDPDDLADFKLPDQQELIDTFLDGFKHDNVSNNAVHDVLVS